ncbi:MAG TPA: amidase [Acidimicrobiales bacterium]
MSTFITKLDSTGDGPRVAVKDLVDVAGVPTTAGCRAVERTAARAAADARCLAGTRAAGARLVGKTNLQELAMLPIGTNPWFGTPVNPLDPERIPGGSSSGSAVAVAIDEADVAIGSDTGGSIRVPSACCGTVGLKTTYGRVPVDGVWPLAPSLDTVGPMARDAAGLTLGMQLLEPGFQPARAPATVVGRIRTAGHPQIEAAIDAVLQASGVEIVTLDWDGLDLGGQAFMGIFFSEIWNTDHELVEAHGNDVGGDTAQAMALAAELRHTATDARQARGALQRSLSTLFERVQLLALPTLPVFPLRVRDINPDSLFPVCIEITKHVAPFNVAGTPATAQPVPVLGSHLPASLQLVGPMFDEELLISTAALIEAAVLATA